MTESAKGPTGLPEDIAALSFEQAMGELDSIVRELEQGTVELDRAVGAYERGVALKRHCDVKLRDARMTVERISIGPDGAPSTSPLDGV
ncbi:MAG: exodeoxyribonuclease VII small subunit [Rhodospirillum sp.]|nr:exodeoxyribonuclease VII small subunit [Rhodospirillum sp.]MCF8492128.1 exodeoxyribonuclease VII small subunit [Rhodospirillum sp.]MCF8502689.1 exodeoxyribonuclease VII small subunit [Rhodospirillum sp.]